MLSAYHVNGSSGSSALAQQMEMELLASQQQGGGGLLFREVAEALESAKQGQRRQQRNLVVALVDRAIQSRHDNPALEIYALLRVLLPEVDISSVYGFKTSGILKSFAKAMEKCGGLSGKSAAAQLHSWIKEPKPLEVGKYMVSQPETAIAMAQGKCFSSTASSRPPLSLLQVVGFCQKLTNIYKERHKISVGIAGGQHHIDTVAEALVEVLPSFSYLECKVFVKMLLRTLPMGVGTMTVMSSLGPYWENFLRVQRDLPRLAVSLVQQQQELPSLVCGVPFTPMTCHATSSPYLVKWLFSKEDTVQRYLTPKYGKLVIHSSGTWYVPLKASTSAMRNRFVSLENSAAIEGTSGDRRKHMLILREIRRSKDLIREEAAWGYLIHYMLYTAAGAEQGSYSLLLRDKTLLKGDVVELVDDASVVMDDPPQAKGKKETKTKKKRKEEGVLESLIIPRAQPMALTLGSVPILVRVVTEEEEVVVVKKAGGLIAQRKMDGDRMQAHMYKDAQGKPVVKLFTKKGRPVHMLYGDVAQELEHRVQEDQPCILDGEIIAVDKDGVPLPWCSNKWRYDSSVKQDGTKLANLLAQQQQQQPSQEQQQRQGIVSLVNSSRYGYNPLDDDESDLPTFAPNAHALSGWDGLGASDKQRLKVKELPQEAGRLLFVVFDLVMLKGRSIANLPYSERLDKLKKMPSLQRLKHTKVITESWSVQNAEDVMEKMTYMIRVKGEGLIIKDPSAKYEFKRSLHQRKLKVSGPDINCGVVGLGFTHSRNPRLWGLLTAIQSNDRSKLLVYNRVESLEGDRLKTAGEHILGLSSLVPLHTVLHHSSKEKPIRKDPWYIYATYPLLHSSQVSKKDAVIAVTWQSMTASSDASNGSCTLYFLQGVPKDIQWLCNPMECQFGLSQRGDIYPVDWRGEDEAASVMNVLVPRFPVGRIQLNDHHRSEYDTPSSIETKFSEAAAEDTCLQAFLQRKVAQLRSRPPRAKKLEELRQILTAKQNPKENWPQRMPVMYTLQALSDMLVKEGYDLLNAGERMVLAGTKEVSIWDVLKTQTIEIPPSSTIDAEKFQADKAALTQRYKVIKQTFKGPFIWRDPRMRTACNLMKRLTSTAKSTLLASSTINSGHTSPSSGMCQRVFDCPLLHTDSTKGNNHSTGDSLFDCPLLAMDAGQAQALHAEDHGQASGIQEEVNGVQGDKNNSSSSSCSSEADDEFPFYSYLGSESDGDGNNNTSSDDDDGSSTSSSVSPTIMANDPSMVQCCCDYEGLYQDYPYYDCEQYDPCSALIPQPYQGMI